MSAPAATPLSRLPGGAPLSPPRSSGNDPRGPRQQQHRALTIPEMVRLICEHLEVLAEPHHEGSRNRRNLEDLAALARTCRDFENPALDILWRVQNTLANALKCLPSNLWEETLVPNDGSYCLRLTSAAQGAEWDRPLAHARRVRRLILDEWSSPYAFPDRDLLEIISSSLPQEYLFPNLRNIRLEPHDDAELSFIPLFAGPQLTDITLSVDMSASGILLLPTLDLRYQQLTNTLTFSEQALFVSKASGPPVVGTIGKTDDIHRRRPRRHIVPPNPLRYRENRARQADVAGDDDPPTLIARFRPFYDLLESSCFYYGRAIFDVTRTLMHYVINSPRRRIVPGRHQICLLPSKEDNLWDALQEQRAQIDEDYVAKWYKLMTGWVCVLQGAKEWNTHY
ncbi:hypothetical protein B0H14DRAFT_2607672 [Mycena olivaceomarginata]|nr:hypothetical protein B0H14DRAFT_2607672 [Mycena olivaceomarginata]